MHQRFFVNSEQYYPTSDVQTEIEPFTSCVINLVQYRSILYKSRIGMRLNYIGLLAKHIMGDDRNIL